MITIWKYRLKVIDKQAVPLPEGSRPLHVGTDPAGDVCLWCEVNNIAEKYLEIVYCRGTGQDCDNMPPNAKYIGTVCIGLFVWHYYIALKKHT